MKNSLLNRLLGFVLLVASAGLVLGALYAFRRNCEGFGCPNAGLLWGSWAAVYAVVGASGASLRRRLLPGTPSRRAVTFSLGVLAALGVVLVGYWAVARIAA